MWDLNTYNIQVSKTAKELNQETQDVPDGQPVGGVEVMRLVEEWSMEGSRLKENDVQARLKMIANENGVKMLDTSDTNKDAPFYYEHKTGFSSNFKKDSVTFQPSDENGIKYIERSGKIDLTNPLLFEFVEVKDELAALDTQIRGRIVTIRLLHPFVKRAVFFGFCKKCVLVYEYTLVADYIEGGKAKNPNVCTSGEVDIRTIHHSQFLSEWTNVNTSDPGWLLDDGPLILKALVSKDIDPFAVRVRLLGNSQSRVYGVILPVITAKTGKGALLIEDQPDFVIKIIHDDGVYKKEKCAYEEWTTPFFYLGSVDGDIAPPDYQGWFNESVTKKSAGGAIFMHFGVLYGALISTGVPVHLKQSSVEASLEPLWKNGYVHRDVRPSNILWFSSTTRSDPIKKYIEENVRTASGLRVKWGADFHHSGSYEGLQHFVEAAVVDYGEAGEAGLEMVKEGEPRMNYMIPAPQMSNGCAVVEWSRETDRVMIASCVEEIEIEAAPVRPFAKAMGIPLGQ